MAESERRRVGERGQVTLPKELRDRLDIDGGDDVIIREEEGKIVVEKPITAEDLAEGYRRRADRDREIAESFEGVSREANEQLGDEPDW